MKTRVLILATAGSSITCHHQVFAKPALWPALNGLVFAAIGLGAPMSQAADATVTIRPDARHQTILGWSGMPWYPRYRRKSGTRSWMRQ